MPPVPVYHHIDYMIQQFVFASCWLFEPKRPVPTTTLSSFPPAAIPGPCLQPSLFELHYHAVRSNLGPCQVPIKTPAAGSPTHDHTCGEMTRGEEAALAWIIALLALVVGFATFVVTERMQKLEQLALTTERGQPTKILHTAVGVEKPENSKSDQDTSSGCVL